MKAALCLAMAALSLHAAAQTLTPQNPGSQRRGKNAVLPENRIRFPDANTEAQRDTELRKRFEPPAPARIDIPPDTIHLPIRPANGAAPPAKAKSRKKSAAKKDAPKAGASVIHWKTK